jgi:hypothetical protein
MSIPLKVGFSEGSDISWASKIGNFYEKKSNLNNFMLCYL